MKRYDIRLEEPVFETGNYSPQPLVMVPHQSDKGQWVKWEDVQELLKKGMKQMKAQLYTFKVEVLVDAADPYFNSLSPREIFEAGIEGNAFAHNVTLTTQTTVGSGVDEEIKRLTE